MLACDAWRASAFALQGDAANLVDPILGEGIRYAVMSGVLAAQSIAQLCGEETFRGCDSIYSERLHTLVTPELDTLFHLAMPNYQDAPQWFYSRFICDGYSHPAFYSKLAQLQRQGGRSLQAWRP